MERIFLFLLLLAWLMVLVQSHIVIEETPDRTNSAGVSRLSELLPPISIVDLTKASRRVSRLDAEKNKLAKRKRQTKKKLHSPPVNCVPLLSSCRPPVPPCCEPCAICHCHVFQTVCYYKMANPKC
ncbi:agouti-signaling protein-like [Dendropsophus ebraccatus]|uniref:agouti-signaling protein-like n=1 Tax=Dendropsophus ebraccatus TaxID=150705 RepID=UPI003831AFD0